MTSPANAFASGDGLLVLEPGESLATAWGILPGWSEPRQKWRVPLRPAG